MKKEIARLDPSVKEGEKTYTTYLVLLAGLVCGPNVSKIAKFTGIPREQVAWRGRNLRRSGVWKSGKIHADWFKEGEGGIAFICDAGVAEGLIERAR